MSDLDDVRAELAELRAEVADIRVLASMADRDAAGVRGIVRAQNALHETQTEQVRTLRGIAETLGVLVAGSQRHEEELAGQRQVLDAHTEVLRRQSEVLKSHGEVLRRHSEVLDSHSEALNSHGEMLTRLVEGQTVLVDHASQLAEKASRQDDILDAILRRVSGDG